jgi:hypothetical protein
MLHRFYLAFFLTSNSLGAQSIMFQKGFGSGTEAYMLRQTPDSGYVITSHQGYPSRPVLIKTDKLGDIEWTKYYWVSANAVGTSVERTLDGGFVMAGFGVDSLTSKRIYFVIKTDTGGSVQWAKKYVPNDDLMSVSVKIKPTNDTGYVMAAEVWDLQGYGWFQVTRLDPNGNLIWQNNYNKNNKSSVYDIELASPSGNKGFVIVGQLYPMFALYFSGILVTRISDSGTMLWTHSYFDPNTTGFQGGYSIKRLNDGGYIVTGEYDPSSGYSELLGLKLDSGGTVLWCKYYDTPYRTHGHSVLETPDNGYLFSGYMWNFAAAKKDAILIKTDYSGTPQWSRGYGSHDYEDSYSVTRTLDGGYAFCGYEADTIHTNKTLYVVKTNSTGGSGCNDYPFTPLPVPITLTDSIENTVINTSSNVLSFNPQTGMLTLPLSDPCALVGINEVNTLPFNIHPNPSNGNFTLAFQSISGIITIEVTDITGRNILRTATEQAIASLDLSWLLTGAYLIRVSDKNSSHVKKLVIH